MWNEWSSCSRDCDGGMKWRRRHCTNPAPLGDGLDCLGHAKEAQDCHTHSCQGLEIHPFCLSLLNVCLF